MAAKKTFSKQKYTITDLPPKVGKFVEYYVAGNMPSEAARQAGYDDEYGKQLMLRKDVRSAIADAKRRLVVRAEVNSTAVIQEICCIGFSDARGLCDKKGRFLPPNKLPEQVARAVSSVSWSPAKGWRYQFWNKNDALEKLMNYLGVYPDGKNDPKKLPAGDGGGSDRALTHEEKQEAVKRFLGWDRGRAVDGQGSGDGAESPPDVPGGPSEVDGTTDEPGPLAGGPAPLPL